MSLGCALKRRALDAIIVVLAIAGQGEIWLSTGGGPQLIAAAGALSATLPLLARRRFPSAAPLFVFAALAALSLARPEAVRQGASVTLFALLVAFWIVGTNNERHQAVAGVAVGLATLAVLAGTATSEEVRRNSLIPGGGVRMGAFNIYLVFFVVLGAGLSLAASALGRRARRANALEERAARLEREREEQARVSVAAERRRIARDLHDVIAHGLSVIVVQAGAARLLLDEKPERAGGPLLSAEEAGRETLAEMRRLLGMLRMEEANAELAPRPGLAALAALLPELQEAGLSVELAVTGQPRPLAPGVELSAYLIVQEALTSAAERAASHADVALCYGSETLELEVASDARSSSRNGDSGGLVGMRERVALYAGEFEAGPGPGGGYAVRARFPVEPDEPLVASARHPESRREPVPPPEANAEPGPSGLQTLLRRRGFDVLVVALAVVSQIEIWATSVPGPKVILVPSILLWTLPLLWRRRFPFAAPVVAFAAQGLSALGGDAVGGIVTAGAALFLTFWAVGAHNERIQALAGVAIGFASMAIVAGHDVRIGAREMISTMATGGALAFIGFVLQRRTRRAAALEERAARVEREREEAARAAVAAERRRIARDLHDMVAHSVSIMTVQAGAARLVLAEQPKQARESLLVVEETGRQALADMRRLLGILRTDERQSGLAPRPGLAALPSLLSQVRMAGLPVELAVEGDERALPPGVELAVYRIAQEALTNARKHGMADHAGVALRYGRTALELEVTNDGRSVIRSDGRGHGLVGMRERVALYGGELQAGPRVGGGYAVRARLPLEAAAL